MAGHTHGYTGSNIHLPSLWEYEWAEESELSKAEYDGIYMHYFANGREFLTGVLNDKRKACRHS